MCLSSSEVSLPKAPSSVDFSLQDPHGLQHFPAFFVKTRVGLFWDYGCPWDAVFCNINDVTDEWGEGVLVMEDITCDLVHAQLCKLLPVSLWEHPVAEIPTLVRVSRSRRHGYQDRVVITNRCVRKDLPCIFNSLGPHAACWAEAWDCQQPAVLISLVRLAAWHHAGYKWYFPALLLPPKLVILPKYSWFHDIFWVLFVKIWTWMVSTNIDTQTSTKNTLT